jgi:hypothetical protein
MSSRSRRGAGGERGATLAEFALIFGLLVMIALGAYEYGMTFRDWLSVTMAAREGGRVAASAANFGDADCVILEATSGGLQSFDTGRILFVHIYKSDGMGSYPGDASLQRIYRPAAPDEEDLIDCSGWVATGTLGAAWEPEDRVNTEGEADWIGVRVDFRHDWQSNFLWWNGSIDWSDDAVFSLEPPVPTTVAP